MWYSSCTRQCRQNFDCPQEFSSFGWVQGNCFWCRYDCMWETVEQFEMWVFLKINNLQVSDFRSFGYVPQFHGKWPFAAIPLPFGLVIQEPASVVFSLLNLLTFFLMLRKIKKMDFLPRRTMWIFYAHVGLFTWVGSTVFHTMDCHYTELLDYNGAVAFIITALYVSMVFVYGDDPLYGRLEWYYTKVAPLFFIGFYLKYSYEMFVSFASESDYSSDSEFSAEAWLRDEHEMLHINVHSHFYHLFPPALQKVCHWRSSFSSR